MKKLTSMVLGLSFTMISFAQAGEIADRAANLADRLAAVEKNLNGREVRDIQYALDQIEYRIEALERWQGPTLQLTCLSNGSSGSWEKFFVTDLKSGTRFGGETEKQTCQKIISTQTRGMVCASNGSSGSWEKFKITKLDSNQVIGGETTFSTCQKLMEKSTRNYICVSNGSSGSWEKFTLLDRQKNQTIGGETTLETCLSTIPR